MNTVVFLPGMPFFPILLSILFFFVTIYRSARLSSGILSLIVFVSIFYQLTGFMVWTTTGKTGFYALIISVGALFVNLLSARQEATSMAIAILAIAVMFTPFYYLSVAFIVAAAAIGGLSSIGAISLTYIITMAPLLIIENGFAFGGARIDTNSTPILFSQLTNFARFMRPPLPGLNIFLTWFPPNFFDPNISEPILNYLSSDKMFLLLVPVSILAIVFSISAGVAGVINNMLNRLSVFERTSQLLKILSPLIASLVTPLTFVLLITSLSPRQIGGYQTTLQTADTMTLLLTSLILGAVFTVREYGIQWLERTEKARTALIIKIDSLQKIIDADNEFIRLAQVETPAISLGQESQIIAENVSIIEDIRRGLSTADVKTLDQWIEDLDTKIGPQMSGLPEVIRLKVIGELNFLISLIITYNNTLKEAGLDEKFSDTTETKGNIDFKQALKDYSHLATEIKNSAKDLFEYYKATYAAYNVLESQPELLPPVDPMYLFESNFYDGGVKLIAEEYWLNFHIKNLPELENNTRTLIGSMTRFQEMLEEQTSIKIEQIKENLQNPKPVNSVSILENIKVLKQIIDEVLNKLEIEIEQLDKLIKSLMLGATRLINFQVMQGLNKLNELKQTNMERKPSLRETSALLDEITSLLRLNTERKNADENNLIMISQYPLANKIIESELKKKRSIEIIDLPFQRQATIIYAKLFAYNNAAIKYDDDKEVIIKRYA